MRRHLGTLPAALLLVLASTAAFAGAAGAHPAPDPGGRAAPAAVDHRSAQAEAALAKVKAIFAGNHAPARTAAAEAPDVTMALRDLALLKGSLSAADRKQANAFLARPTDGIPADPDGYTTLEAPPVCGVHVCVHYVTTTVDAATPQFVTDTLTTLEAPAHDLRRLPRTGLPSPTSPAPATAARL